MTAKPLSQRLAGADVPTLQEILRQAEVHLNAQLTTAIAADQRAYTFVGLISAAAVIDITGAYTLASQSAPQFLLALLALVVGAVLLVSAGLAAHSARSIDFAFPGSQPVQWESDVADNKELGASLAEQCQHYDEMIISNRDAMKANGSAFNMAVALSFAALTVGIGTLLMWLVKAAL